MIIDSHVHLFSPRIIHNVSSKREMVKQLSLQTEEALERCHPTKLTGHMKAAGVSSCLLLPTAAAAGVVKANDQYWQFTRHGNKQQIMTAGTLHPAFHSNAAELQRFLERGIKCIKLCTFSQGFALDDPATLAMFELIAGHNESSPGHRFFVVIDTFYEASRYFGASPAHITTPQRLADIIKRFPGIDFIAAHMGGQRAPFEDVCRYLQPAANLYLDTANGAHTLSGAQFIRLLRIHGEKRVIFGTDWPWFETAGEITLIEQILTTAGLSQTGKEAVFSGNIARLLGI